MSHVIKHGNVVIYDDMTLIGDTTSNNQSYLSLSDVTDSSMIQIRPYSLRSFKSLTTASRDTDSTYWGVYQYGYDLLKYSTQDTTLKLRDGYVYAKDSVKTGLFKSLSGTDSTLITDGTIVLTDSIIGDGASVLFTASAETLNWNSTTGGLIVTGNAYIRDSILLGDTVKIYKSSQGVSANKYYCNSIQAAVNYNPSGSPFTIRFNQGTNPLIRWLIRNEDSTGDSSIFEDSTYDITGDAGRIKIKRQTTITKPLINNNMFILAEGRFKDDTVFMLTDTFTTFTSGMQFIDTTGDDSLYTRVRNTWIKQ
jgi:hypothetical protein